MLPLEYRQIIKLFDSDKINYCVLRNFDKTEIDDLDILVASDDVKKTVRLLQKSGFTQTFKGPMPGHLVFIKLSREKNSFVNVDIHAGGLTHNGILYFKEGQILRNKKRLSNFFVPSKADYEKTLILHSIIDKRYFKPEYEEEIRKGSYKKLIKSRNKVLLLSLIRYPKGLINFSQVYAQRILKVLNPFYLGPLMVFVGPDGSGKTTLVNSTADSIRTGGLRVKKVYMGWRGSILPFIKSSMAIDKKLFKTKEENRHFKLVLRSLIITTIYFSEMYLRYLTKILPSRKIGAYVLTDRYFYDRIALDDNLPDSLKGFLLKAIPKPNICFYLTANPKVLAKRESNLAFPALARQYESFEATFRRFGAVRLKSDTATKNELKKKITENIWNYIRKK